MRRLAGRGSTLEDQREAPRSSLMLRIAKIVAQGGEYPCLMRDVSAGGISLRFFHKVVPEQRVILEQANGATWPIERVWARGHEAGYRFACDVDVETFIAERSKYPDRALRLRIGRPALVALEGQTRRARTLDLSCKGARLEAEDRLPVGSFVKVAIEGFPLRYGHVKWRDGEQHGIDFQGTMPLDEFARHILAMQPFRRETRAPRVGRWAVRAA